MLYCKAPAAHRIKTGTTFYSATGWVDDNGKVRVNVDEWLVRSIRAKRGSKSKMGFKVLGTGDDMKFVNLAQKNSSTWIRRSSKIGDYGWDSSIPDYYRKQFQHGADNLPYGIHTTPLKALIYARASTDRCIASSKKWLAGELTEQERKEIEQELSGEERTLKAIKTRITKIRKSNKKADSQILAKKKGPP
ncbi:MAG: hypothetical protein V7752_21615 [Halopseudomonas sp.]